MIGKRYWILIWWGILALGVTGLIGAIHWSFKTHWGNLEEVLRGIGTVTVSVGMLLLLHGTGGGAGQTLLLAALIAFILAFAVGRDRKQTNDGHPDHVEDAQGPRSEAHSPKPEAQSPKPEADGSERNYPGPRTDDFPPHDIPNP
ncbi:MAG TPA: hypothetical protein VN719_10240 [Gemmatimonadales bacterium]|nr:hypothetical protein [Gemmatimonadales bacterium]